MNFSRVDRFQAMIQGGMTHVLASFYSADFLLHMTRDKLILPSMAFYATYVANLLQIAEMASHVRQVFC